MDNWMQKYEQMKDEKIEKEQNRKLEQLFKLLENAHTNKEKAKIIEEIIKIYEELKINACEYNNEDYILKRKELKQIRYEIMGEKYQEEKETKSWNEYKEEELKKENINNEEFDR